MLGLMFYEVSQIKQLFLLKKNTKDMLFPRIESLIKNNLLQLTVQIGMLEWQRSEKRWKQLED
jgi:hypothetical protein